MIGHGFLVLLTRVAFLATVSELQSLYADALCIVGGTCRRDKVPRFLIGFNQYSMHSSILGQSTTSQYAAKKHDPQSNAFSSSTSLNRLRDGVVRHQNVLAG